jgi:hypothetical protein
VSLFMHSDVTSYARFKKRVFVYTDSLSIAHLLFFLKHIKITSTFPTVYCTTAAMSQPPGIYVEPSPCRRCNSWNNANREVSTLLRVFQPIVDGFRHRRSLKWIFLYLRTPRLGNRLRSFRILTGTKEHFIL